MSVYATTNGTCTRCGKAIKYLFYLNGKPYGSDCIQRITGRKFSADDCVTLPDGTTAYDPAEAKRQRDDMPF